MNTVRTVRSVAGCCVFASVLCACLPAFGQGEPGAESPWSTTLGLGYYDFEGDEEVKDGLVGLVRVGYDLSARWGVEGVVSCAPQLAENFDSFRDGGGDADGLGDWDSTWLCGLAVDALHRFGGMDRTEPYVALGLGWVHYGDKMGGGLSDDLAVRLGVGVLYHINDQLALQADYRGMVAGENTEANSILSAGVRWRWGATMASRLMVVGGVADTDGDGLTDEDEARIGTNPLDPDTDKDGLRDGEEVHVYRTDPLNPDTDYDGLKDGPEVHTHKTNPLDRDTDDGGVADGHEVLEDSTNPLDPMDDLLLYTLNIEFDTDSAVIKSPDFGKLDVIGKVLTRDPGATARVEGHADQRRTSGTKHNQQLSERRAKAVCDYLAKTRSIARDRMQPVGYGFSRPVAANDPVSGNPRNRRTEVYVRPSDRKP